MKVHKGDIVRCASGGGGGFGDPVERAAEQVRADILDRHISKESALTRYGIGED